MKESVTLPSSSLGPSYLSSTAMDSMSMVSAMLFLVSSTEMAFWKAICWTIFLHSVYLSFASLSLGLLHRDGFLEGNLLDNLLTLCIFELCILVIRSRFE